MRTNTWPRARLAMSVDESNGQMGVLTHSHPH